MQLPKYLRVRQRFPERRLPDIPGAVISELEASGMAAGLPSGARVAIGAGSRGIANLSAIVGAAVRFWQARGMAPFLFPAMGSHGAATAEGQVAVLARYGITEETMGCPISRSMDVVSLGSTSDGIETVLDRAAFESDGVMVVNRVKWHTSFEGHIESGLFKMMAIGLGRFAGAQHYHMHAYRAGLEAVIRSVGRKMLASGKVLGGLAVLEDAYHNTAQVTAVRASDMESREVELLAQVKSWMGRILVDEIDVLILDEIGKEISGTGMDTKVVNRSRLGEYNPWPYAPRVHRIFVRDLSPHTAGSAMGIGMADMVTDRLLARTDWKTTYINSLTAGSLAIVRTPIHFATDRECLEALFKCVGKAESSQVTYGWIRNSLALGEIGLSENLRGPIERHPQMEIQGLAHPLEFDAGGNLVSPFLAPSSLPELDEPVAVE